MRSDKFKPIEALFADYLKKEAGQINEDFEDVICNSYTFYPENDWPQHGFFCLSLECLLDKADLDKTDAISLCIDVDDHRNNFKINMSVSWGYPYAQTIDMVFDDFVDVTEENLLIIQRKLPEFVSILRQAILTHPKGI